MEEVVVEKLDGYACLYPRAVAEQLYRDGWSWLESLGKGKGLGVLRIENAAWGDKIGVEEGEEKMLEVKGLLGELMKRGRAV